MPSPSLGRAPVKDVVAAIGNTPMIKLRKASELTGCTILAKAEYANTGGSIKDRTAKFIIEDAEARGLLKPGGVIVEGTAGNTGIGLTVVGNAKGYRCVIVVPETQSTEKKDLLRLMGADVREVKAVPAADPNHYVKFSQRLAEELSRSEAHGAIWANQFDNLANRNGHARETAAEIWADVDGRIDGFVSAVGTGGTLAGVGMGLKERNRDVVIALADPMGAALYNFYAHGQLKAEGTSITEGIGQGRITANMDGAPVDDQFQITDAEALPIVFDLVKDEGICVGGSTGVNIAGTMRLAKKLGPGKTIVTFLTDSGARYQSKLFNVAFLKSKGLPVPSWLDHP